MSDTPEIERLRDLAWQDTGERRRVWLEDAIHAVRDTEARVRDHYALSGRALREVGEAVRNSTLTDAQKVDVIAGVLANGPLDDAPGGPCEDAVFAARREAFREAVEALREEYDIDSPLDWDDAARFIESRFLSHPDNPASDLMRPSGWQLHEVFDDDGLDVVAVHVVPTWETHRIEPSCWCEPREDDGVFIHRDELERSGPDDPEGNA